MNFLQPKKMRVSHAKNYLHGFTIIELMITITIVVLVTGLVMVQYSSFNNSVLLTDQAYLTAFDIREAQSLAVSVRGQGAQFHGAYGLYFDMSANNKYILFQDKGSIEPAQYDTGEEVGLPYKVDPRFIIADICGTNGGSLTCGLRSVAISFKRPNFDAAFYSADMASLESVSIKYSPQNGAITRTVTIYKTGQVSVQ